MANKIEYTLHLWEDAFPFLYHACFKSNRHGAIKHVYQLFALIYNDSYVETWNCLNASKLFSVATLLLRLIHLQSTKILPVCKTEKIKLNQLQIVGTA